jgi:hypothetical protein
VISEARGAGARRYKETRQPLSELIAERRRESFQALIRHDDVAVLLLPEEADLLPFERKAGRTGDEVPMDVAVPGCAAERQDVEPLTRNHALNGGSHSPYDALKSEVLGLGEIADDVFTVLERRHEDVTEDDRIPVEERDRLGRLEHHGSLLDPGITVAGCAEEAVLRDRLEVGAHVEGRAPL